MSKRVLALLDVGDNGPARCDVPLDEPLFEALPAEVTSLNYHSSHQSNQSKSYRLLLLLPRHPNLGNNRKL